MHKKNQVKLYKYFLFFQIVIWEECFTSITIIEACQHHFNAAAAKGGADVTMHSNVLPKKNLN